MTHITMQTLLGSIERRIGKKLTHSELARGLNVSEQVVTNWAKRGISVEGALAAQFAFHTDANFILGRLSHPMLHPRDTQPAPDQPLTVQERRVSYLPEPIPDPLQQELLELFGKIDDADKREWLADLRGYVRGRRPHNLGHSATVASRK